MAEMPTGTPFHGEILALACNPTAQAFTLYAQGGVTTLSVGPLDKVVVEHCVVQGAASMQCQIFDDQDGDGAVDAGELICSLATATTASGFWNAGTNPHYCKAGTTPKLFASAVTAITASIRGVIMRG